MQFTVFQILKASHPRELDFFCIVLNIDMAEMRRKLWKEGGVIGGLGFTYLPRGCTANSWLNWHAEGPGDSVLEADICTGRAGTEAQEAVNYRASEVMSYGSPDTFLCSIWSADKTQHNGEMRNLIGHILKTCNVLNLLTACNSSPFWPRPITTNPLIMLLLVVHDKRR